MKYINKAFVGTATRSHIVGMRCDGERVVGSIDRSLRDPAAGKGPSHRPDTGRSYAGPPNDNITE